MFDHIIRAIIADEKANFLKSGTEAEWAEVVDNGEIVIDVIDTRHDLETNIIEPKVRLTNLGGDWVAWCNDGESAADYKWQEA